MRLIEIGLVCSPPLGRVNSFSKRQAHRGMKLGTSKNKGFLGKFLGRRVGDEGAQRRSEIFLSIVVFSQDRLGSK